MEEYKKSDRNSRNEKIKTKINKFFGSQKHIRIQLEKHKKTGINTKNKVF